MDKQIDILPKDMQMEILSKLTYTELSNLLATKALRETTGEEAFKHKIHKDFPNYALLSNRDIYYKLITELPIDILHFGDFTGRYMNITDEYILLSHKQIKVYNRYNHAIINTFALGRIESQPVYHNDHLYFIVDGQVRRLHIKTGHWIQSTIVDEEINSLFLAHGKIYAAGIHILELDFDMNIVESITYPYSSREFIDGFIGTYHDGYVNYSLENILYVYDKNFKEIGKYGDAISPPCFEKPFIYNNDYFVIVCNAIISVHKIIDGNLVELSKIISKDNDSYGSAWAIWGDILITAKPEVIFLFSLRQGKLAYLTKIGIGDVNPYYMSPIIVKDDTLYIMDSMKKKLYRIELNRHLYELMPLT